MFGPSNHQKSPNPKMSSEKLKKSLKNNLEFRRKTFQSLKRFQADTPISLQNLEQKISSKMCIKAFSGLFFHISFIVSKVTCTINFVTDLLSKAIVAI